MSVAEILPFLSPDTRLDVQQAALKLLISISASSDDAAWRDLFLDPQLNVVEKLMSLLGTTPIAAVQIQIVQVLVNLTAREGFDRHLLLSRPFLSELLSHCESTAQPNELSKSCADLLTNMSRTEETADRILTIAYGEESKLDQIAKFLLQFLNDPKQESLGDFLRNLSQLDSVRQLIIHSVGGEILSKCLQLLQLPTVSVESKRVAADLVKNCSFEVDAHGVMLGVKDFVALLLWPLAGPEEFDAEDNEALPVDLQYLEADKQRESDSYVRLSLLNAILQLCATAKGREFFRSNGAYLILREYHKWEKFEDADIAVGNIIGLLIRTEDEIGVDNLTELKE